MLKRSVPFTEFKPARFLRNRHIQTLLGVLMCPTDGVSFQRQRIDTPDGDFIDLDFPQTADSLKTTTSASPIVLLLPGVSGSPRVSYSCELFRQLGKMGIRSVGMNYRSCSGEANRLLRTYHAGDTDDLVYVLQWLRQQYPDVPLGAAGVSFGGNILLKYLGEGGDQLTSAVAISPPFNLSRSAQVLESGTSRLYSRNITGSLKQIFRVKSSQVKHIIDVDKVLASQTVREFDANYIAPLHGFADVESYYEQTNCGRFLKTIRTPTLIITSKDDPFHDPSKIPYETIDRNPWIDSLITEYGGHVGFAKGGLSNLSWWAHQQSATFLQTHLEAAQVPA